MYVQGRFGPVGSGRAMIASVLALGAVAALAPTGVQAQVADESGADDVGAVEEVVITGSRLGRSTFTTPNPITVLNAEDFRNLGLSNVGDIIAELPQNSAFVTSANVGNGNFNIGAQLANLRGLNPFFGTRTLTLVNTRRFVATTNGGAVDLNVIPSTLVGRVETVTGGASAAYGSDAVAGVVNVILDSDLRGFKGEANLGQTFLGDGRSTQLSAAFGSGFADDRGSIVLGVEYVKDDPVDGCTKERSWCADNYAVFTNGGYATPGAAGYGEPRYVIGPDAKAFRTSGGAFAPSPFTPAALVNKRFNQAGTALIDFDPGNYASGAGIFTPRQGGDDDAMGQYDHVSLRPEVKRHAVFAHARYDLTDSLQGYAEGSYSNKEATNLQLNTGTWGFPFEGIYADNAYLPASVAAQFPATPGAIVPINRGATDLPPQANTTDSDTWRVVGGLTGDLRSNWKWDAYYTYGRTTAHERIANAQVNNLSYPFYNPVLSVGSPPQPSDYDFYSWALDAVRDPGNPANIVCRATLPGPAFNPRAAGCIPLNIFGVNNGDPAAIAYAYRTLHQDTVNTQQVASASVHGDLFPGWGAGAIGAAAGIEYRTETIDVGHDLANQPWYFNYILSYGGDYQGKLDVWEGFTEVNVPLLKDLPFARYLDLDGAIRVTRNKTTDETLGGSATDTYPSWKLSAVWDVVDWLRFRVTRSRDVRSASFYELFSQQVVNGGAFGTVQNPWSGTSNSGSVTTGGNPAGLDPEKADTWSAGVVFTGQSALDGFRASADWYQIDINGAISALGAQQIVTGCFNQGVNCGLITGIPNGTGGFSQISAINNYNFNLGSYTTRGVDLEAAYTLPLNRFADDWEGRLNFRLLGSWLYDMVIDPGSNLPVYNYAGQTGPTAAFGNFNTSPKWQGNAFMTYVNGRFSGTVQARYVGPGKFRLIDTVTGQPMLAPGDAGYAPTLPNSININEVASAVYVNLAASYDVTDKLQIFGAISNALSKKPVLAPGGNGYPTNPVYFDTFGAAWKLGARFSY